VGFLSFAFVVFIGFNISMVCTKLNAKGRLAFGWLSFPMAVFFAGFFGLVRSEWAPKGKELAVARESASSCPPLLGAGFLLALLFIWFLNNRIVDWQEESRSVRRGEVGSHPSHLGNLHLLWGFYLVLAVAMWIMGHSPSE
jgi:hypothetical protein